MRFKALELRAFGPFTDLTLDFGAGTGLHIIHGPNEAGKSSALRAIDVLLFGFPHHAPDAFLHRYDDLRVGALLDDAHGNTLGVVRRKGRQKTLRDHDDAEPIDESALTRLFGGATQETFDRLFHLDHPRLVAGGKQMAASESSLGEKLFAGAGADPARVLAQLRAEYEALFAPRAQNPVINAAIRQYESLRGELRALQLSAEKWERQQRTVEELRQQRHGLDAAHARQAEERTWLSRIQLAQTPLARRTELHALINRLEAALGEATRRLLMHGDAIDALRETLPVLENHRGLHARAEKEAKEAQEEAATRWNTLRPGVSLEDGAAALSEALARKGEIRALAAREEALQRDAAHAGTSLREIEGRIAALRMQDKQGEAPPGTALLQAALEEARPLRGIDREIEECAAEIHAEEDALARGLAALGLWTGTLEELRRAPIPPLESVRRHEEEEAQLNRRRRDLEERREEIARALETNRARHARAIGGGDVLREDDLARARQLRDRAWRGARQAWERGDLPAATAEEAARLWKDLMDGEVPPGDLAGAVEQATANADTLADRLRREADRVAEIAQTEREQQHLEARLAVVREADAEWESEREIFGRAWQERWQTAGIARPLPPGDMRMWCDRVEDLRQRAQTLDTRKAALNERTALRDRVAQDLAEALAGAGEVPALAMPFQALLTSAEASLDQRTETRRAWADRRATLEQLETEALPAAAARVHSAQEATLAWQRDWTSRVAPLGLDAGATTAHALDVLEQAAEVQEALQRAAAARARAEELTAQAVAFEARARDVAMRAAPELADGDTEHVVRLMYDRLEEARGQARELEQATAECTRVEATLREHAAGMPLDSFVEAAAREETGALPERMATLDAELGDIDQTRQQLTETIAQENARLQAMDGSGAASAKAQDMETVLAQIRMEAGRYARLRVAAEALRRGVETYRGQRQAPLIARAGQLFARLTPGRFSGLRVDYDEEGAAQLVALRAESGRPTPPHALSDGTADQLYLALRLASVEAHLAASEPLPFIADDICINFDDERAGAALEVLHELAEKTQVIFLTHHHHLLEIADTRLGKGGYTRHDLQPAPL